MLYKIADNVKGTEFEATFIQAVSKMDKKVKELVQSKNFTFLLAEKLPDIISYKTLQKMQDEYDENVINYPHRGITTNSDGNFYITVFTKYLKIEHLEAILYHETGHFIDGYKAIEVEEPDMTCFLSHSEEFLAAYKKDLTENWDKIKQDRGFRIKHCIQSSTPDKIDTTGALETFAELFRFNNGKINDEKTVELYFLNSAKVQRELIKKTYDIGLLAV